ncbi:MAG: hypothetical protein ACK6BC_12085 [Cyanobacteriota bacterium]
MATLPFSVSATAAVTTRPRAWPRRWGSDWAADLDRGLSRGLAMALSLGLGLASGFAPLSRAAAAPPPAAATPGRPGDLPRSQRLSGSPPTAPAGLPAAGAAPAAAPVAPMSEAALAALLRLTDLDQLNLACLRVVQDDNPTRLRLLQNHLLELNPAPQPLPVVLANAEVLLTCRGPRAALSVLDPYGPGPGAARVQWLLMQWRAANAALDHRRAALALERLSGNRDGRLNQLSLPIRRRDDGTVVSRSAAEVLAGHLEARGFAEAAGQLLARQSEPGAPGAARLGRAVALLTQLPLAERDAILETALNQAAAVGAWGLVSELLDAQAALPNNQALARRLRLSPRLDDAYGEWLLLRDNPAARSRAQQLEGQLRSPRAPGGHAALSPLSPPTP